VDWVALAGLAVAGFALYVQWRSHRSALDAQATESREGRLHAETLAKEDREHALALIREDRLWARRADLYARILEVMRNRIENPEASKLPRPEDDPDLTALATQANVMASRHILYYLNKFVYDGVDRDEQIQIWDDLQTVVYRELNIPRD
jgi:hypothetical protein